MVTNGIAELIVGVKHDTLFGAVLVIGSGGIFTELLRDTVSLILPVDEHDVRRAIAKLHVAKLLDGFRGRPAGDLDEVVETILKLTRCFVDAGGSIGELEVNPLIVGPAGEGVVAVDALMTRG